MKINLINYEIVSTSQILSKFAWRMSEELDRLGISHTVTDAPDSNFDINHHIIYSAYRHVPSINTLMVTHIDSDTKYAMLAKALETADMGVFMSKDSMDAMIAKGLPAERCAVVLPAHDNDVLPLPVAILTNVYSDRRKREYMLAELAKIIDTKRFLFRIMGQDWDVGALKKLDLNIEYYPNFQRDIHDRILRDSKYYLYMGLDEGSMGTVDAKRAGLKTIATPQGFHIELGLDYPFMTQEELNKIFLEIQKPVLADWTWAEYTKKHITLWEALLAKK